MFNINKGVISYITKDGSEGSLIANIFNMKKINKLLSKQGSSYDVSSNLSLVYFKNIIFDESPYFLAKDVVVILENCIFNGEKLSINGGYIDIINPIISSNKCNFSGLLKYGLDGLKKIKVRGADDFRILIDSDKSDRVIDYDIFSKNIEVDGGKANFNSIIGGNVCLKNLEVFSYIQFRNIENLYLGNLSFDDRFAGFILNVRKKLYLSNINFYSIPNYFGDIFIECPCIEIGSNVLLATYDLIKINDDVYFPKNGNPIVLSGSDLLGDSKVYSRKVLISILKGYRDLVEQCILNKSKEDEVLSCYNGLINTCKNDIKKLENKLETLECNKQKYSENLEKKLFRSKAIDYVKK